MTKCCSFDKHYGIGGELQDIEGKKTSGFCCQLECGWVAVYPEDGDLVVQVGLQKWKLLSKNVDVDYFHLYDEKQTKFAIMSGQSSFEHIYSSWWAERDDFEVNPMAASSEEENSEEDIFGYINMLKDNDKSARNLAQLWSKNITP